MQAIYMHGTGGPEVLREAYVDTPVPGSDQLLIK